jgi:DNA-binding beta-propeller fold protein YncE
LRFAVAVWLPAGRFAKLSECDHYQVGRRVGCLAQAGRDSPGVTLRSPRLFLVDFQHPAQHLRWTLVFLLFTPSCSRPDRRKSSGGPARTDDVTLSMPRSISRRDFLKVGALSLAAGAARQGCASQSDSHSLDGNWPLLSDRDSLAGHQFSGIALTADGSLLALHHGENHVDPQTGFLKQLIRKPAVFVLDSKTGKMKSSWGANLFMLPHQISTDSFGGVWIVDSGLKRVFKFDQDGARLLEINGPPAGFNLPTDAVVLPDRSVVVADGSINRRGFLFDEFGKFQGPWGLRGKEAMQFHTSHSITSDDEGRVYIADRENHWVQVLSSKGQLLDTWEGVGRPATIRFHAGSLYVLSNLPASKGVVRRFSKSGEFKEMFQTKPKGVEGDFEWPHGLAVADSGDSVYVGFVLTSRRIQRYRRTGPTVE